MSATVTSSIETLDAILLETTLLLHQVSQGSVKSAGAVERVCALVAADVKQRVRDLSKQTPPSTALRRIQAHRARLGAFEFQMRRAAAEMNATLGQFLPSQSSGTYSPDKTRMATAGAWMNVRSSP
jgi:hypothetical protein